MYLVLELWFMGKVMFWLVGQCNFFFTHDIGRTSQNYQVKT